MSLIKPDSRSMMATAFFGDSRSHLDAVFPSDRREVIGASCSVYDEMITLENFDAHHAFLCEVDVIFSSWGMPVLTMEQVSRMPRLKALFYAGGTVKAFAVPFLERGVTVVSAWAANAVPVAEFVLAQVILANKGYFRNSRECSSPEAWTTAFRGTGNFHATVSLLGAGMIGRKLIELMKPFDLHVLVFDPFLSAEEAERLGVEKVDLSDAFHRGQVVSNHLANVPGTRGLLDRECFEHMREHAVFINTGRGATVVEADLVDVLVRRPDLTALLDVTDPEPPATGSCLYTVPNLKLSSHIAGSIGGEIVRMADTVIEDFHRWRTGLPLQYAVTSAMLETMA